MSDHDQRHEGHSHDSDLGPVESSSMSPKPVLLFLIVLGVSTAFVFVVVKSLDWAFTKLDVAGEGQKETQVQTDTRKLPPEPLLQGAPGEGSTSTANVPTALPLDAMENLRNENEQKLGGYGWIDKPAGIARVPIDRAKEMIADRGLPSLTTPGIAEELRKAETVRRQVLNAGSSAGRMIKAGQNPQSATEPQSAPQPQQNEMRQQVPPQQ